MTLYLQKNDELMIMGFVLLLYFKKLTSLFVFPLPPDYMSRVQSLENPAKTSHSFSEHEHDLIFFIFLSILCKL